MSKKYFLLVSLIVSVLVLSGCGSSNTSNQSSTSDSSGGLLSRVTGPKMYQSSDFDKLKGKECEILSMDMITPFLGNTPKSEVESMSIFGCSYTWDKSNKDEIEQRNVAIISEGIMQGNFFMPNLESSENTVSLTYTTFVLPKTKEEADLFFRNNTNLLTPEEQKQQRDAVNQALNDLGYDENLNTQANQIADDLGVSGLISNQLENGLSTTEKQTANSLMDIISAEEAKKVFVEVQGVGDRAAWSDYGNELVVQLNNFTFTLNVDVEASVSNKEAAISIGKQVVQNFKSKL